MGRYGDSMVGLGYHSSGWRQRIQRRWRALKIGKMGKHTDQRRQCERKEKTRLERGDARSSDEVDWTVHKSGARSGYRQLQNNTSSIPK